MSKVRAKEYQVRIDHALATPKLQDALHKFGDAFLLAREKAFSQYDFEALRQEIADCKDEVAAHHQQYLDQFVTNAEAAGATVYLAKTAADANQYIADLARTKGVKLVTKSKSMASEETHLNQALESAGVEALETDLGE